MGGVKLDGAGAQKMKTIEEALMTMTSINSMVERAAMEVKAQKPIGTIPQAIKRIAVPLQGQLKGQFGMIADQVAAFILSTTRGGGGDQAKIRSMREQVAQIKTALELSAAKVKEQHAVPIDVSPD
jgi:HAMP domain-containing protein